MLFKLFNINFAHLQAQMFYVQLIFNKNVKIANKDCLFYSSSDCGKMNGFEMYRFNPIRGRFSILGWAYYPTPWG